MSEQAQDKEPEQAQEPRVDKGMGAHAKPYVRQRPAHRSVEPIDDLAQEEDESEVITHDSAFTTRGSVLSGRGYRRSRERTTRIKTVIAAIVVLAVLAVVVFFLWEYMQANWGSTAR